MQPAKNSRSWREALKFINKCPVCGAAYAPERAQRIAEKRAANLVHISCDACRGNFVALIMATSRGISSIGMVSDLTFEDVGRTYLSEPIGIDELIEGRNYINQNNLEFKFQ